jgi:5-methylcytosine-specific restriction endonuclease McrA
MAIRKSSNKKTKASKKVTKASGILSLKTRNAGTMTESAFWSFIRSSLRQKSRWWKPITQAKDAAKRKYKGPNKRQKWEYLCNVCNNYFPNTEINVDHIIPAGTLRCAADLPGFVERLFCEVDNLQVLCNVCHNKKTQDEKSKK